MSYAHPEYLITTEALAHAIEADEPELRIFDATVFLRPGPSGYRIESGREAYEAAHVPGAAFMDLVEAFADPASDLDFTLPTDARLSEALGDSGVSDRSRIVVYSRGHMMWATRAWWMLASCGLEATVLDGGFKRWENEARAIETGTNRYQATETTVAIDATCWASKEEVLAAVGGETTCILNALSPDVYAGTAAMSYGRPGHITGSRNLYYDELLANGGFRSASELSEALAAKGALSADRVICYCGGGISATVDALALKLIGHEAVAVYDGSMREWAGDESLPLETGPDA